MKTPERVNWEQYNRAIFAWMSENVVRVPGQAPTCRGCERQIAFKWVPLSIHFVEFDHCAGGGMVLQAHIPYCTHCDKPPGPGCLHLPLVTVTQP